MEQAISAQQIILFLSPIIPLVVGFFAIRYYLTTEREKYATKEYVKQEIKPVEVKVKSLENDILDQKDDLKYIRRRLDDYLDSKTR